MIVVAIMATSWFLKVFLGAVSPFLGVNDLGFVIVVRLSCVEDFETCSVLLHGVLIWNLHVKMNTLSAISDCCILSVQVSLALCKNTFHMAARFSACVLRLERWQRSWFAHIVHSFLEMGKDSGVLIVIIFKL